LVGSTFNVSAQFSAGSTTSTSVAFTTTYTCEASPSPCQGVICTQILTRRTVNISTPINSQTFFWTHGLRPGAPSECHQNPGDCPVDTSWTRVGNQVDPCNTGSANGTGTDEITGFCTTTEDDCPPPCGEACPPGAANKKVLLPQ
jgi:hypothetical protein